VNLSDFVRLQTLLKAVRNGGFAVEQNRGRTARDAVQDDILASSWCSRLPENRPIIHWTDATKRALLVVMKPDRNETPVKTATIGWNTVQVCLLLAVGLFLSACKQDAKVANGKDPTGVYTLVTVNGNKVSATVSHDGGALQVRSGTFTINADGTCSSKLVFAPPSGAESSVDVSATYTREGSRINMQWKGAGTTTGTIDGNTFTMENEGMVFAYKK